MNRTNRLAAIIYALQQGQETAHSLGQKFEVSRRTILRDVQCLLDMNVPIITISGPGGGFRLIESYVLPPLQLDPVEVATLIFALEGLNHDYDTDLPCHKKRSALMNKIKSIVPPEIIDQIEPLLTQMHHYSPNSNSNFHQRDSSFACVLNQQAQQHSKTPTQDGTSTLIRARLTYQGMIEVEQDEVIGEKMIETAPEVWEVSFHCPMNKWASAVRFFYRLGHDAEVIEPEHLRYEIGRLAEEVRQRYITTPH